MSLVDHASHMKGAIPILKVPLAWICFILNILIPGLGKSHPLHNSYFENVIFQEQFYLVGFACASVYLVFHNTIAIVLASDHG